MKNRNIVLFIIFIFPGLAFGEAPNISDVLNVGKFRNCISTRDCTPTIDCNQPLKRDTRNCKRKVFAGMSINDPTCEAQKAAQNAAYQLEKSRCEAEKSARKLDCERIKAQELSPCRLQRSTEIDGALELQKKMETLYEKGISAADSALSPKIVFALNENIPDSILWAYRVNYSMRLSVQPEDDSTLSGTPETINNIIFPKERINTNSLNLRLIKSLLMSSLYEQIGLDGVSQAWLYDMDGLEKFIHERAEEICSNVHCI